MIDGGGQEGECYGCFDDAEIKILEGLFLLTHALT